MRCFVCNDLSALEKLVLAFFNQLASSTITCILYNTFTKYHIHHKIANVVGSLEEVHFLLLLWVLLLDLAQMCQIGVQTKGQDEHTTLLGKA